MHDKNCYANALQYYGIRLLPLMFRIPTLRDKIIKINLHVKYLLTVIIERVKILLSVLILHLARSLKDTFEAKGMMRNIPEERWPQPHCGGNLKF